MACRAGLGWVDLVWLCRFGMHFGICANVSAGFGSGWGLLYAENVSSWDSIANLEALLSDGDTILADPTNQYPQPPMKLPM